MQRLVQSKSGLLLFKGMLFVLCLLPALRLFYLGYGDQLGANPIEVITRDTGEWSLRFLLITLLMTPLRHWFSWKWPLRVRRMLGLYGFFYACLHLGIYLWLDQFFDWQEIAYDILDRPFITIGMLGFLLLLPLVITSTNGMMKRLGRDWKRLHRLAYLVPVLGVLHYWWLVKADIREPLFYGALLLFLLLLRWRWRRAAVTTRKIRLTAADEMLNG